MGDFSQTFDRTGRQDVIYDPNTTRPNPANPATYLRNPFPGNIIPTNRINNISNNVMQFYPLPNRTGNTAQNVNNFLQTGKAVTNTDNYLTRIDHVFNDKMRIFGRAGYVPNKSFSTLPGVAFASRSVSSNPATSAMIAFTTSFTPNLLGEARLSYTRLQFDTYPVSQGFDAATLGFGKSLLD